VIGRMGFWEDAWDGVKSVGNVIGDGIKKAGEELVDFLTGGVSEETRETIDAAEGTLEKISAFLAMLTGNLERILVNTNDTLERFKTVEQPKIEDIMDSVDDNLEESKEILEQVKKLFVTKKKIPLPQVELDQLPDLVKGRLQFLTNEMSHMESAVTKDRALLTEIRSMKAEFQPTGINVRDLKDSVSTGSFRSRTMEDPTTSTEIRPTNTAIHMQSAVLRATKDLSPTRGKYFTLNSRYEAFKAYQNLHFREINKIRKEIDRIKFVYVDEPGVIPRTLAKVEDSIARFNIEEQPRIEKILDSINGNLIEGQGILGKINSTFGRILGLVDRHTLLVKIGLAAAGGLIVFTLALIPILILRWIIFGIN
jgi:uncharacterized protein YoxC